jgi:hypothetical protein
MQNRYGRKKRAIFKRRREKRQEEERARKSKMLQNENQALGKLNKS